MAETAIPTWRERIGGYGLAGTLGVAVVAGVVFFLGAGGLRK